MRLLPGLIQVPGGGGPPPTPVAVPDAFSILEATTSPLDVLANDQNLTLRSIAVTSQPARGAVTPVLNGTILARLDWTDTASGVGATSFSYTVDGSNAATVNLSISATPLTALPVFRQRGASDTQTDPARPLTPQYPLTNPVQAGDVFFAHVVIHADSGHGCPTPPGWLRVGSVIDGDLASFVFRRDYSGGETGTQAFTWTGVGAAPCALATVDRYANANGAERVIIRTGTGLVADLPTVFTDDVNARPVAFLAFNDQGTITSNPSGAYGGEWLYRARTGSPLGARALSALYDVTWGAAALIESGSIVVAGIDLTLPLALDTGAVFVAGDDIVLGIIPLDLGGIVVIGQDIALSGQDQVLALTDGAITVTADDIIFPIALDTGIVAVVGNDILVPNRLDTGTIAVAGSDITIVAGYTANPVVFDGTNDWANLTTAFTGAADTTQALLALSVRLIGTPSTQQWVVATTTSGGVSRFSVTRTTSNTLRFVARETGSTIVFDAATSALSTSTWHHILYSKNGTTSQCFVDDASSLTITTNTAGNIGLTAGATRNGVGARPDTGAEKLNGELADVALYYGTSMDLTVTANRRLFFSAANQPVDKGSDGSIPTGTAPILFLSGATAAWHTNKGTGGGLTLTGALTDGTAI